MLLDRIAGALGVRQSLRPWTLAEVSPAAGLSPAGLIKRFGSRKAILLALSRRWLRDIPKGPLGQVPPREELDEWAHRRFGRAGARGVAQGLIQLVDDLMDDELRVLLEEGWAREQEYVATLLRACELKRLSDPGRGAILLFDALNGAMLRQAVASDTDFVQETLDSLWEIWT
ncbi:MAG: hypothetical protein Q4C85_11235 [Actinomyces sp.]|uniref:TetR/AcrR family transcriptional regulator n=1 Tax=Actinomyces sp. TaxID=29317 RepID=UPI0026DD0B7D|nr:hypothetical protein [Actinomyces sp.]MDO4244303.1 hypothetical protein [Actinomyces sp.]